MGVNWIALTDAAQLEQLIAHSTTKPQLIFKHSTRCSTSSLVLHRIERSNLSENYDMYYLDLIRLRSLSDGIAATFGVRHESPQVLIIEGGKCVYNESHLSIDPAELEKISGKQ